MLNRRLLMLSALASATALNPAASAPNPEGKPRIMLGPMLGAIEQDAARIWLRLSGDYFDAIIQYRRAGTADPWKQSAPFRARSEDDFCVTVTLDGLAAGTAYDYQLRVDGGEDRYLRRMPPFRFQTAPAGPAQFSLGFGSCARIQDDPHQPIWRAVDQWSPDLFFWLGDNIYGDSLNPEIIASEYRRQRFVPSFQPVGRNIPQLAVWDDHDYGLDNFDHTNPIKADTLALFKNYWANPAYGIAGTDGVFFSYTYGGVDFFALDGRYYRHANSDPDTPQKTLLGTRQTEWLMDALSSSRAPFKILICGSGWSRLKGPGGDSWAAFQHARRDLFDFIREEGVEGVVLLSGDTHYPHVNCIPESDNGGYDLYDLVSSPLGQIVPSSLRAVARRWAQLEPDQLIRPPVLGVNNFGLIEFDLTRSDPELRFNAIETNGRVLWSPVIINASELRNGIVSWPGKK